MRQSLQEGAVKSCVCVCVCASLPPLLGEIKEKAANKQRAAFLGGLDGFI